MLLAPDVDMCGLAGSQPLASGRVVGCGAAPTPDAASAASVAAAVTTMRSLMG